ncbi:MAG TPA: ferric reductase-like transmembrane domain-containing protein [Novosphingobium sp.]|nr:ferric reductase-like transmembrane domain-containing protein [Novosphingobium sp.]
MRTIINSKYLFWLVLALPGLAMLRGWFSGTADAIDLLHPTGETAIRLMVLALCLGPLAALVGPRGWLRWLIARRRWIGVAAFAYALAHLVCYAIDLGTLADIWAEAGEHAIWTGWAALLAMAIPAATSSDPAMRLLRAGWKRAQQFAYPAAFFTVLHWGLIELHWIPALLHIAPVAALNLLRWIKLKGSSR